MAFDEDLSVLFSTGDFAVAATYNASSTVNVIFDRAYLQELGYVASAEPQALADTSDIPSGAVGKTLLVSRTTYTINSREP